MAFKIDYTIEKSDLIKLYWGNMLKLRLFRPFFIGFLWKVVLVVVILTVAAFFSYSGSNGFLTFLGIEFVIVLVLMLLMFFSYLKKNFYLLGNKVFTLKLTKNKLTMFQDGAVIIDLYPQDINWVTEIKSGVMIMIDKKGKFAIPRQYISTKQVQDLMTFVRNK